MRFIIKQLNEYKTPNNDIEIIDELLSMIEYFKIWIFYDTERKLVKFIVEDLKIEVKIKDIEALPGDDEVFRMVYAKTINERFPKFAFEEDYSSNSFFNKYFKVLLRNQPHNYSYFLTELLIKKGINFDDCFDIKYEKQGKIESNNPRF